MPDGRTVGYADFGPADGTPVIWCHGGPGSRLEPTQVATEAAAAGFRLIGVDRPGYGLSTPWPERSIAGWVPDGLAVLDALGVEQCIAVGVSTGGAYALALAAAAPDRGHGRDRLLRAHRHALARGPSPRRQPDDHGRLGRAGPRRRHRVRDRGRRRGRVEDVRAAGGRDAAAAAGRPGPVQRPGVAGRVRRGGGGDVRPGRRRATSTTAAPTVPAGVRSTSAPCRHPRSCCTVARTRSSTSPRRRTPRRSCPAPASRWSTASPTSAS